ncbi:MAG TPA: hypothetical protein PKK26_16615, partial [Candidatus Wallbacteria bacterium]|nr:hypothetical protein [Candidatus Wallbacteria bacterium]
KSTWPASRSAIAGPAPRSGGDRRDDLLGTRAQGRPVRRNEDVCSPHPRGDAHFPQPGFLRVQKNAG